MSRLNEGFWLALFALLALGAMFRAVSSGSSETLQVGKLELVDAAGQVRARLELVDGQPVFSLLDGAGIARLSLEHDAEESALYIRDAEGTIRLGAAQFAHGGGGYALHGPGSKGAAVLYLKGQGSLSFYDAEGNRTERFPE